MLFDHVVAVSEQRGTVLIRCPQCGWLYEDDQRSDQTHISPTRASEWSATTESRADSGMSGRLRALTRATYASSYAISIWGLPITPATTMA